MPPEISLVQQLRLLEPHRDDPRIAADIACIDRHLARMEYLRTHQPTTQHAVKRDHDQRIRAARRVVEQRTSRALRKLGLQNDADVAA